MVGKEEAMRVDKKWYEMTTEKNQNWFTKFFEICILIDSIFPVFLALLGGCEVKISVTSFLF